MGSSSEPQAKRNQSPVSCMDKSLDVVPSEKRKDPGEDFCFVPGQFLEGNSAINLGRQYSQQFE